MKDKGLKILIGSLLFTFCISAMTQKGELVQKFTQAEKRTVQANVPKTRSVQRSEDFITQHAYDRHVYNPNKQSTANRTQYGQNIDVQTVRRQTMQSPDKITFLPRKAPNNGVRFSGTDGAIYSKRYKENISTRDTPTNNSKVIVNNNDKNLNNRYGQGRSTQYPNAKTKR